MNIDQLQLLTEMLSNYLMKKKLLCNHAVDAIRSTKHLMCFLKI